MFRHIPGWDSRGCVKTLLQWNHGNLLLGGIRFGLLCIVLFLLIITPGFSLGIMKQENKRALAQQYWAKALIYSVLYTPTLKRGVSDIFYSHTASKVVGCYYSLKPVNRFNGFIVDFMDRHQLDRSLQLNNRLTK